MVEIGSFRGRSTIVLARAADAVVAIDPHAGSDRGPQEIAADAARGDEDLDAFRANLARAGVADRVRHVRRASAEALGEVDGAVALLFVDGAHRYGPARADMAGWGRRVAPGGDDAGARRVLLDRRHARAAVGVRRVAVVALRRPHRLAGRVRAPAAPLRARPRANAARQLAELPWFARNVAIKALVLARLRRWAGGSGCRATRPGRTERARQRERAAATTAATATQWTAIRSCAYSGLKPPRSSTPISSVSTGTTTTSSAPAATASGRAPIPRHRTRTTPSAISGAARAANTNPSASPATSASDARRGRTGSGARRVGVREQRARAARVRRGRAAQEQHERAAAEQRDSRDRVARAARARSGANAS